MSDIVRQSNRMSECNRVSSVSVRNMRLAKDRSVGRGEKSPFPFIFNMLSIYTYSMYATQKIS